MRVWEVLAAVLVFIAVVGTPVGVYAYEYVYLKAQREDVITLTMRTPEHGNLYPREIHVKQGDLVRLRITSEDVAHGLNFRDFDVKVFPIDAGKFKTVEFVADQVGTFKFVCNNRCSLLHSEVYGYLIVDE